MLISKSYFENLIGLELDNYYNIYIVFSNKINYTAKMI